MSSALQGGHEESPAHFVPAGCCWLWCGKVSVLQGRGHGTVQGCVLFAQPATNTRALSGAQSTLAQGCAGDLQKSWVLLSHNQFVVLIIKCCFTVLK